MNTIENFQYYTHKEAEQHAYYSIPKELFTNPKYKHISTDAKLLYGLLRDRNQLSIENNWVDDSGHIYIVFTRENVEELLSIKRDKCIKLFKELVDAALIKDVRQGLNKPNIIYVGKIIPENKEYQLKSEKPTSGNRKNRLQEIGKTDSSNTDINNTDINNQSINQSDIVIHTEGQINKNISAPETESALETIYKTAQVEIIENENIQESVREAIKEIYMQPATRSIAYKIKINHIDIAREDFRNAKEAGAIKNNYFKFFVACLVNSVRNQGLIEI